MLIVEFVMMCVPYALAESKFSSRLKMHSCCLAANKSCLDELELTVDLRKQLEKDFFNAKKACFSNMQLNRRQRRKLLDDLLDEIDSNLNRVLSPKQRKRAENLRLICIVDLEGNCPFFIALNRQIKASERKKLLKLYKDWVLIRENLIEKLSDDQEDWLKKIDMLRTLDQNSAKKQYQLLQDVVGSEKADSFWKYKTLSDIKNIGGIVLTNSFFSSKLELTEEQRISIAQVCEKARTKKEFGWRLSSFKKSVDVLNLTQRAILFDSFPKAKNLLKYTE